MALSVQQYVQALYEALHESKHHDAVIDNLVQLLKREGNLNRFEQIVAAYEVYDRDQRGLKQIEVTTAGEVKLDRKFLDKLNEIAGADTEVKRQIDERLVGGIVIRVDDTLIDASIKGQLTNLKETLSK